MHGNAEFVDVFIAKLFKDGDIEWIKTIDSSNLPIGMSRGDTFIESGKDTFMIVFNKAVVQSENTKDINVIKFTGNGTIIWKKQYSKAGRQLPKQIIETKDGGYFIVGGHQLNTDNGYFYALKIDALGEYEWEGLYSLDENAGHSAAFSTVQTSDGGYFITGYGYHAETSYDMYIVKIDSLGNWMWEKNIDGGMGEGETACRIFDIGNDRYLLTGGIEYNNVLDAYMAEVDTSMEIQWEKKYNHTNHNHFTASIVQNPNDQTYTTLAFSKHNGITHHHFIQNKNSRWSRSLEAHFQNRSPKRRLSPRPSSHARWRICSGGFCVEPCSAAFLGDKV